MNGPMPVGKVSTPYPSKLQAGQGSTGAVATRPGPAEDKLKRLCLEFESFFLNELLKRAGVFGRSGSAWDPSAGGDGETAKAGGREYASMATETLAGEVARMGGLGLGDLLYDFLKDEDAARPGHPAR